jgi:hypothetical protein
MTENLPAKCTPALLLNIKIHFRLKAYHELVLIHHYLLDILSIVFHQFRISSLKEINSAIHIFTPSVSALYTKNFCFLSLRKSISSVSAVSLLSFNIRIMLSKQLRSSLIALTVAFLSSSSCTVVNSKINLKKKWKIKFIKSGIPS